MGNFDFDDLKKLAKDAAETIADKSLGFYKMAESKTKTMAKITRLSTDISLEKSAIKKKYAEIGRLYYSAYKSAKDDSAECVGAEDNCKNDELLKELCNSVSDSFEKIAAKNAEIEEIKASNDDIPDDIEVEIIKEDDEIFAEDTADVDVDIPEAPKEPETPAE